MIYKETKIKILDNSGAKLVRCFKLENYSKKNYNKPGQIITGSVIKYKFNRKVAKKQICKTLLISSKKQVFRKNGVGVKFDENRGVIVSDSCNLLGTRIFGPVLKEVRNVASNKLMSLAKIII